MSHTFLMLEEVGKKCEGRICKLEESTVKRKNTIYFTNHFKNIMLEQNTFMHPNSTVRLGQTLNCVEGQSAIWCLVE
jgi:hypothetical protein